MNCGGESAENAVFFSVNQRAKCKSRPKNISRAKRISLGPMGAILRRAMRGISPKKLYRPTVTLYLAGKGLPLGRVCGIIGDIVGKQTMHDKKERNMQKKHAAFWWPEQQLSDAGYATLDLT